MSRPRIYTFEEIRERKHLYDIEYRKRNAEKIRAYRQRPEVMERQKAHNRRWRDKHPEYQRAYYAAHREAFREYNRKWRKRHEVRHGGVPYSRTRKKPTREQMRTWSRNAYARRVIREMLDYEYYAHNRARNRAAHLAQWRREGKTWGIGKPAMRIPDYCVRGGVLDTSSPYLWNNLTASQRAYARELAIERMEWRNRP